MGTQETGTGAIGSPSNSASDGTVRNPIGPIGKKLLAFPRGWGRQFFDSYRVATANNLYGNSMCIGNAWETSHDTRVRGIHAGADGAADFPRVKGQKEAPHGDGNPAVGRHHRYKACAGGAAPGAQ